MSTSAYKEFTGKSVEEALRIAREDFGVGLDDLDFEILTPGSRGVLGMGAEPARILAAPRSELGGAAPKREAAAQRPLPPPAPRDDEDRGPRSFDRDRGGFRDRGPRRDDRGGGFGDRGPRREGGGAPDRDRGGFRDRGPRPDDRGGDRPAFRDRADRPREDRPDAPEGVPVMDEATAAAVPAKRAAIGVRAATTGAIAVASATAARAATTAVAATPTEPRAAAAAICSEREEAEVQAAPRLRRVRASRARGRRGIARGACRRKGHPRAAPRPHRVRRASRCRDRRDEPAQRARRRGRAGGARRVDRAQGRATLRPPAPREPDAVPPDGRLDACPGRRRGLPGPTRAPAPGDR